MGPQIVEQPPPRTRNLAPSITDVRAKTIEAGFEQNNSSDDTPAYRVLNGEKIAVPAPVLEHREQDIVLRRDAREMSRLVGGNGEWLVDHDVAPRTHRQLRERGVRLIGARNHEEVYIRVRRRERLL